MHRKLVDETGWLSEKNYVNALGFCMLLPGPEAMQLATYCGWKPPRCCWWGSLQDCFLSFREHIAIFALAAIYSAFGNVPLISQLFLGIKAAVLIVVLEALIRLSKRALTEQRQWVIAGLAFVAIFFLSLPFPVIVLTAGLYGAAIGHKVAGKITEEPVRVGTSASRTLTTVIAGLVIWLGPLMLLEASTRIPDP